MSDQLTISEEAVDQAVSPKVRSEYTATEDGSVGSAVVECDWLPDVRRQLEAIAGLPAGWDSYRAPPPDRRILHSAACLLVPLCQVQGLVKPHINPTPSGGVQFEWETGPRYFEIEVVAERAATWFFRDDAAAEEAEGEVFERESLAIVVDYLRRAGAVQ